MLKVSEEKKIPQDFIAAVGFNLCNQQYSSPQSLKKDLFKKFNPDIPLYTINEKILDSVFEILKDLESLKIFDLTDKKN